MNAELQRAYGLYGRTLQLFRDARAACQKAYAIHKAEIKKYEECLAYANKRMELCEQYAAAAVAESKHLLKRALEAEAELFEIKNNQ